MLSTPNIKRGGGRCNQRNQPIILPEKIEKVRFTTFIAFDLHWYLEFDDILRHMCHATCHAKRKSLHFSLYIGCFADYTGCSVPLLLSGSIGNDIDKHNVVSFVTLLWYYITKCAYTAVAWNLNQLMKPLAAIFLPTRSTCFWLGHQISNMNCNNDIDFHDNQGSCKISIICFLCFGTVVGGLWLVLYFMILFVVPTSF